MRSSFDGFHSVASPGRYSKVLGSRMISGSYMQSQSVFSDWLERQANGVSMPHWPTATTRRSPCATAREGRMSGAAVTEVAVADGPTEKGCDDRSMRPTMGDLLAEASSRPSTRSGNG